VKCAQQSDRFLVTSCLLITHTCICTLYLQPAILCAPRLSMRICFQISLLAVSSAGLPLQLCDLRGIVEVKNKYEAHSIGAMGATGRGVCEHLGVNFDEVDILMGTFTKSFGSTGGYIASSKAVIRHLRENSPSHQMVRSTSAAFAHPCPFWRHNSALVCLLARHWQPVLVGLSTGRPARKCIER
jgi:Aminotransferase class I and II